MSDIRLFNGWQVKHANLWNEFDHSPWILSMPMMTKSKTHWRPLAHTAVVICVCVCLCVVRYIKRDNGAKKSCFHGNTYRCVSGWQRDWSSLIQQRCLMHRTQRKKNTDIHRLHNHRHTHYRPSMHLVETFTTWLQFAEWKHLCLQKSRERKTCWFV